MQFLQPGNPVPDGGYGHLVQSTGGLLPVAGDKRDGGAPFEQFDRGQDLVRSKPQLVTDPARMLLFHISL